MTRDAVDILRDHGIKARPYKPGDNMLALCPNCSHLRRKKHDPCLSVLIDRRGVRWRCHHCGWDGWQFYDDTRDETAAPIDPRRIEIERREGEQIDRAAIAERLELARRLWSQRRPIAGSPAEIYLRQARGYSGWIPATLAYLPARAQHPHAMIAAFGIPTEPEPGRLAIDPEAICGVHLTKLAPDGRGKAGTDKDKRIIGRGIRAPIVLAPVNDLGGMVIAEGIEDALSGHEATGLGAWAAGCASRLPALAAAVPFYVECVSLLVDPDPDGQRHAAALQAALQARQIETRPILFGPAARAA